MLCDGGGSAVGGMGEAENCRENCTGHAECSEHTIHVLYCISCSLSTMWFKGVRLAYWRALLGGVWFIEMIN